MFWLCYYNSEVLETVVGGNFLNEHLNHAVYCANNWIPACIHTCNITCTHTCITDVHMYIVHCDDHPCSNEAKNPQINVRV